MLSWPLVYLKPMLNYCGSCFFKQKKLISLPTNLSHTSDICTIESKERPRDGTPGFFWPSHPACPQPSL